MGVCPDAADLLVISHKPGPPTFTLTAAREAPVPENNIFSSYRDVPIIPEIMPAY